MTRRIALTFALLFSITTSASAGDWPQFLGPNRNGKSKETGLIDSFPESGPKVVWKVKGGVGMGGIAVKAGRAYVLVQTDGRQFLLALDAKSGKKIWKTDLGKEYRNDMGDGPRTTPAIDGESAYVFTGEGTLFALKLSDGSVQWKNAPLSDLGGKTAEYGMASSPLVVGDNVIVTAGTAAGTVVAYNKSTGKLVWKAGSDRTGYSSPALLKVGGTQQVVAFTGNSAIGIEPMSGKQLWRYPYKTGFDCNTATPIAVDGNVLISSGENHGSAMLSLKEAGGKFTVTEKWTSLGPRSCLRSEWQTPILHKGYVYGLDNVGAAGPVTNLNCVDPKSGKKLWTKRRFGKCNGTYADGKIWYVSMKGVLILVKPDPKGYKELARSKSLLGKTRQAPAISNGRIFLRDDKVIVCLDVKK